MQVALSVWHDESRGMSRHQAPPDESIDIDGINSDEEDQAGPSGSRQSSAPPTRPPSSASEWASGTDDGFHMDGVSGAKIIGAQGGGDELDFEIEMWDDTPFTDGPASTSTNPTNPPKPSAKPPVSPFSQDEDQDMWDIADELAKPSENPVPPGKPPALADDVDWDDMYA